MKTGDVIWVLGATGRPKRVLVEDGDEEQGFQLRNLTGNCWRLKLRSNQTMCFRTKEEAEAMSRKLKEETGRQS